MKNIGIITLPLIKNYGGILQSYALQKYLTSVGNNAVIIDRQFNTLKNSPIKTAVKKVFFKDKYRYLVEKEKIERNATYFINKYLQPKTHKLFSQKELLAEVGKQNFDALITGSDQVWRPDYANELTQNLFLDFAASGTKKISYAASFGKGKWDYEAGLTQKIKKLVQGFDKISVREDSGIEICKEKFGVEAQMHVDPTMLLTKEDYIELAQNENEPKKDGEVLVYMLDIAKDKQSVIDKVCDNKNFKYFRVNAKSQNENDNVEDRIYPTVTSWLQGFADAEFAIIDSFHGCVFSILFNIPFVAYGNVKRGLTRFTSLLKLFGLEERLILNSQDLTPELINKEIDWELINEKVNKYREEAKNYLKDI